MPNKEDLVYTDSKQTYMGKRGTCAEGILAYRKAGNCYINLHTIAISSESPKHMGIKYRNYPISPTKGPTSF